MKFDSAWCELSVPIFQTCYFRKKTQQNRNKTRIAVRESRTKGEHSDEEEKSGSRMHTTSDLINELENKVL